MTKKKGHVNHGPLCCVGRDDVLPSTRLEFHAVAEFERVLIHTDFSVVTERTEPRHRCAIRIRLLFAERMHEGSTDFTVLIRRIGETEREVLLDDARAQRDRDHRHRHSHRVVGKPHWNVEPIGEIAFARFPPASQSQLYVVPARGGVPRPLFARRLGSDGEPAWSPDGTMLAFTRVVRGREGIVVARRNGTGSRWLTSNPYRLGAPIDAHPRWSPDGRRLVFHRFRETTSRIFLVDVVGGRMRELGPGFEPAWSPDGARIAFADRVGAFGKYDLWTMRPDGRGRRGQHRRWSG